MGYFFRAIIGIIIGGFIGTAIFPGIGTASGMYVGYKLATFDW